MPPAGRVAIQFSVDAKNFSSGIDGMNKQLKGFQQSAQQAGHSTVSSMQAASASTRLLLEPMNSNIRAVERLLSQSKLLSGVMQAAFPVVGAIALGTAIARTAKEIADFYKNVQQLPQAITSSFREMNSAAASSSDALRLTNDRLQNEIDKLNGKPQNNLAISIDETRIASDKLAASLASSAKQVKELLSSNGVGIMQQLFAGKGSTADVSGSVNSFRGDLSNLGFQENQATRAGNTSGAANIRQQIAAKEKAYSDWLDAQIKTRTGTVQGGVGVGPIAYSSVHGDQSANLAILQGEKMLSGDRVDQNTQEGRNPGLEAGKNAAEASAKARQLQAEQFRQQLETDAKLYEQAQRMQAEMQALASESNNDFFKTAGVSSDDNNSLTQAGRSANDYITSLRTMIDVGKQNSDALSESAISMAVMTGQMTRQDAATATAALHLQTYNDALKQLQEQRAAIESNSHISDMEKKAQLNNNSSATGTLNAQYQMQTASDQQSINPASSSAMVGFQEAITDFTNAAKDNANIMKSIVEGTLRSLNDTILSKNPDFKSFASGALHNVASAGLNKAEGSLLGTFGIKDPNAKLGTQANPMYTKNVDAVTGAASAGIGSILSNLGGSDSSGGGFMSTVGSVLKGIVPFLATGGPIDGPAIVGENGPELFVPSSHGSIIPNHKLSSASGGSGGGIHFHPGAIDARNSHDPAQTAAQIQRGIMQAAPHLVAASVKAVGDRQQRRPSMSR